MKPRIPPQGGPYSLPVPTLTYPQLGKPFRMPNQLAGSTGPRYSVELPSSSGVRLVLLARGCKGEHQGMGQFLLDLPDLPSSQGVPQDPAPLGTPGCSC